jgi:hypothetical protein
LGGAKQKPIPVRQKNKNLAQPTALRTTVDPGGGTTSGKKSTGHKQHSRRSKNRNDSRVTSTHRIITIKPISNMMDSKNKELKDFRESLVEEMTDEKRREFEERRRKMLGKHSNEDE